MSHRGAIAPSPRANAPPPCALRRALRRRPRAVTASVSRTCTVRFDRDEDQDLIRWIPSRRNTYPVLATAVGRPVEDEPWSPLVRGPGRRPMPGGSSSGRTASSPASPKGSSGAAGPSTTLGPMCLFSRANPAPCAVSHGAATGPRPMANAPFHDWVAAARAGRDPAQVGGLGRRRPPDGADPELRRGRWIAGGRRRPAREPLDQGVHSAPFAGRSVHRKAR